MKLTIARDALAGLTGWTAATTAGHGTAAPVLAGIMLTASGGTLTAERFGYDASSAATAAAETGEPGRVLVPARILTAVVTALPARHPVTLAADEARLTVTAGPLTCTLLTLPPDEYPQLPDPGTPAAEFDTATLAAAVTAAGLAAGKDDTLPALTCIRLTLDGTGTATWTATDRYRLTITTCPCTPCPGEPPGPVLVPARELTAAARRAGPARLALDPGTATITTAGRHVTIRTIDGGYPDVTRHIPADPVTTVTADVPALAAAVKRAAILACHDTPVRLTFTDSEVLTESGTGDEASLAETLPVTLDGDPAAIALNPAYLLDALATVTAAGSPAARIALHGPGKPAAITPAAPSGQLGCTHVLMPVRLT